MKQLLIAVIGTNEGSARMKKTAFELGREIARRGHYLVCGGMGGVMQESCRGAKSVGGTTIGILPGKTKGDANPYIDIPIVTAMSHARNAVIVRTGDAVVAVGGRYGTLSEIGLALCMNKPVYGLNTWKIPGIKRKASPRAALDAIERRLPLSQNLRTSPA